MSKKVLLGASYSSTEPLAPMHLLSIAKEEKWESKIVLGTEPDFLDVRKAIEVYNPDLLGFSIFTGNHNQIFAFLDNIRKENSNLKIAVGGPHITVFPKQGLEHADYIVPSEGFNSFRRILRGEVEPGIVPLKTLEKIPTTEREEFYRDYPQYKQSEIKSVITQTGCPYRCSYCYNSISLENIASVLNDDQIKTMRASLGRSGRLFPRSMRSVEEIISETNKIQEIAPETKMIFFQDDSFGANIDWLREFNKHYSGVPFHLMTRFEFIDPSKSIGNERGRLLKDSGCSGLTFAIESADPMIRDEVLNRNMPGGNELMFRALEYCNQLGLTARTFSMLGIPYGATSSPTQINLEQDLKNLELNVKLREKTGLPSIAWASTLVPYAKTEIDLYCRKHGHYVKNHDDIPNIGFRDESVLQFPKKWVGPGLNPQMPEVWLDKKEDSHYKKQLRTLMDGFSLFALIPNGHEVARELLKREDVSSWRLYDFALTPEVLKNISNPEIFVKELKNIKDISNAGVSDVVRNHLYSYQLYKIKQ